MSLDWEISFTGNQPGLTESTIRQTIFNDLPHLIYNDAEGVVIGDLFIFFKDYKTTRMPLDLQVLNMTWTSDLTNPNSMQYMMYAQAFCNDVSQFNLYFIEIVILNYLLGKILCRLNFSTSSIHLLENRGNPWNRKSRKTVN